MEKHRVDPELLHYGVKGMKWGVRRTPSQLGHKTNTFYKNRKKAHDAKKKKRIAKKKAEEKAKAEEKTKENIRLAVKGKKRFDELNDYELAEATKRLRAEKEYKTLLQDTGKVKKGQTALKTFVGDPAKKVFFDTSVDLAAQAFKSVGADKVNKWLDKEFGVDIDFKSMTDEDLNKKLNRRKNEEEYANLMGKGRLDRVVTNNKKK